VPATKKRIEETYGGICIDTGSTAEMTPWMTNGECDHRQGMHLWQDIVYAELVDSETQERVPYG
jgi:phenylacetate-CoA ligase